MRNLSPEQTWVLADVEPDELIHIGNQEESAYVGGRRLPDCRPQDLLRLVGLGILRFADPVRLGYTKKGLKYRQRLIGQPAPRAILQIRR